MENSDKNKKNLKTKNNQPIKKISHQDIYALQDLLEQLNSWDEPLNLLNNFFSDEERPVNKQKIAREYYACSKIFNTFYTDFGKSMSQMKTEIDGLKNKEKI